MNAQERFDKLVAAIAADIPHFAVRYKTESTLFKVLQKVVWFIDQSKYTTTVYPFIYYPAPFQPTVQVCDTLEHEWVHLKDCKTFFGSLPGEMWPINLILFAFLYAFPQILALFALLAIVAGIIGNPWWLLWLATLLFLIPFPAPFRAWAEVRAYRRSIELGRPIDKAVPPFKSAGYLWMWPWPTHTEKWLQAAESPYKAEMDALNEN